jgi:hypothetical protein
MSRSAKFTVRLTALGSAVLTTLRLSAKTQKSDDTIKLRNPTEAVEVFMRLTSVSSALRVESVRHAKHATADFW